MGTANFAMLENIESYYVISDEDFENIYDGNVELIADDLKDIFEQQGEKFFIDIKYGNDRNYHFTYLGHIYDCLRFMNIDIEIYYNIYIQSGYYHDANLDFSYQIFINDEEIKEYDEAKLYDIIYDIEENLDYYNIKKGLFYMNKEKLMKKLLKIDDEMREKINNAFKEISCCRVEKIAQFSNGEAIYAEIN